MPIERAEIDDRGEWLRERNNYIGASEIAIVCGEAGTYGSAAELFAEKKGLRPPRDSTAMKRGRWGEASVFQAITDTYPQWEVRRAAIHLRDLDRRIAATPDGFLCAPDHSDIGCIEAKVVARSIFRQRWLDDPNDNIAAGDATIPSPFRLQLLTNMMLAETTWGLVAALVVGEYTWDLRLFEIERDPALEDRICYCVAEFWRNHLDPGVMPEFAPERDEQLIKYLYPKDDGSEIDLSGDNHVLQLVDDLTEAQSALKRTKALETELKTELCAKLGEHSYGRLADGRRLSWRHQHRRGYAVEPSDYRVFRILQSGKE